MANAGRLDGFRVAIRKANQTVTMPCEFECGTTQSMVGTDTGGFGGGGCSVEGPDATAVDPGVLV